MITNLLVAMNVTHMIARTTEIIGDFETNHLARGLLVSSRCAHFAAVVIRKSDRSEKNKAIPLAI
jgi:hypothetical protein